MQRGQPTAYVQPEPEQWRELRVGQVGVEIARDVEERLLEDVGGIEPGPEPRGDRGGPVEVGGPVTLGALEAKHIRRLISNSTSLNAAARTLGIDPSTL